MPVAFLGVPPHEMMGISQAAVVGAYGLLALAYLARFASPLAHTAFPVFLAAMAVLGAWRRTTR